MKRTHKSGRVLAGGRYGIHELGMRVVLAYPNMIPDYRKVMSDFDVSRATAYRILQTLKSVRGIA